MFENKSLTTATFVAEAFVLGGALRSLDASPQAQSKSTNARADNARIMLPRFSAPNRESRSNIASHRVRGAHRPARRCIYFSIAVLPAAGVDTVFGAGRSGRLMMSGIHPSQRNWTGEVVARRRQHSVRSLCKNRRGTARHGAWYRCGTRARIQCPGEY